MFIAIRSGTFGSSSILAKNGSVSKIGTKFGYTSWHPSGRLAVYSLNKVRQFFHAAGSEVRDVVDLDSALAYYSLDEKSVKTTPAFIEKNRLETYPTWSPDGRFLYFCSAPILWEDRDYVPPPRFREVKYDLMRVSYDIDSDKWGESETVLSAQQTGLSIMLPRISPDGRFLLFCMCDYGCFPVYQPSSDLYIMDLQVGEYRKLDINSEFSESWHSWSSNGRWIVFSSKRNGGLYTRSFFSYVDKDGDAYKPFIMPQKDPDIYDSFLKTYSVPELVTGPVTVSPEALTKAVRSPDKIAVEFPLTSATPKADSLEASEPWQQNRN